MGVWRSAFGVRRLGAWALGRLGATESTQKTNIRQLEAIAGRWINESLCLKLLRQRERQNLDPGLQVDGLGLVVRVRLDADNDTLFRTIVLEITL
jgi:hypothetical protein